ncbi:hypothetical protein HPO96_34990 [Kribbella sandramycini]|uniref:Nucleotidyltransferase n=1 Tax=Kribbella sandramycini TaxID=60450 RepID=A0A7Y4P4Q6_9ACTN|nr:hypothetical protein [Kribbella sandramycini]MBB6566678.1 hypothetical protein [Kribbella sandramycini]NOL45469.1 hypothetical protein [Kribbella sandramycini]
MGCTDDLLDDVRAQLAPDDSVLKEARQRRDLTRDAAQAFPGALRTFMSGSLAHKTANCPIHRRDLGLDADCGVVLDTDTYPDLGPDADARIGPDDIVRQVLDQLRPRVLLNYPKATFRITKRAIYIEFNAPLPAGEDPTVDLIVGLDRASQPGLWIPNTEQHRWDPSHPEKHTELLTAEPKQLRLVRAHAIRLAKAENKRTGEPVLCSFNVEALGWMFISSGMSQAVALQTMWERGAADLSRRFTPDPAGVSAPIKVADRPLAVDRLQFAANRLAAALERDDDAEWVRKQLLDLWPEFVPASAQGTSKARLAEALKSRTPLRVSTAGTLTTGAGLELKRPQSYGDRAHQ